LPKIPIFAVNFKGYTDGFDPFSGQFRVDTGGLTCFGVILGSILDGFDPFSGRASIVASEITVSTGIITTGGGSVIGPGE